LHGEEEGADLLDVVFDIMDFLVQLGNDVQDVLPRFVIP
jgi:hypothetical protein